MKEMTESLQKESVLTRFTTHIELIFAIISGVLIFTGWILLKFDIQTVAVPIFILSFLIGGYFKAKEGIQDTIEEKELNVEMLMIIAAIGAAIIGYWMEGAILIFIFALSGALETYTMNRSQKEISALMDIQPEEALRIMGDKEERVHISELAIGEHVLVKPGERIPTDGNIVRGESAIDEAAITGESIPLEKKQGDGVYAGTMNVNGSIVVEVTKLSTETLFQKIINLVQNAQSEKSPSQQFLERFEGPYVKIVLGVVAVMMVLPHFLLGWSWNETFYRAMILLVVASPCALVASIMPATLSAISNGARKGILFKGGVHLENLSHLQAIAFDKTGTLTKGKPEVTDVVVRENITEDEFLYIVGSIESYSNHPLAQAITAYARKNSPKPLIRPDHLDDKAGWGVKGNLHDKEYLVGKADYVGTDTAKLFGDGIAESYTNEGKTVVYVKDEAGIVGILALKDVIRKETVEAIKQLRTLEVQTIMITGDSERTAAAIADQAAIGKFVAECLPETKVETVKNLKEEYNMVGMVGDGINDAPALATANVGIAMGEGTDVALETADVVLMKNDLVKIAEAIKLSKRMNKIIKQNVIFSITVIMLLISSNFLQFIDLPFGVIGHEGSTILVILNGLRLLR
ncbi:MAG: heavy metal translocating P-type ATPase [Bacillota bacterium]|uniref:heavy metal translocating P-type ATPase n=1 Tax=Bacillus sp. RO2 TaxID=2723913 RepID=UPI00145C8E8C|nr:heavy metal translocating P-type ATPase [Bacillus sp. RO2]MEA3319786.1 heavy metal translocating P-type ATPase [Bacillota bacterium]NMH72951.1 cadmium-translocating P-type ATPase [Bacillus sp. RO2]